MPVSLIPVELFRDYLWRIKPRFKNLLQLFG
jgi:hypothetical protein